MDNKELKKAFKKLKDACFFLSDSRIVFMWGSEDGIPENKIYIGRRGMPRPDYTLTPYDIKKIDYTKPGLFQAGLLTVVGADGTAVVSFPFKDKENIKQADKFNECLALYKQYNLGK